MSRRASQHPMDANALRPALRDLFGEIPITRREMRLWLWSVPVWFSVHSRATRADSYLRDYRVAEKIAAAKADGRLPAIFGDEACPHCGAMLENDYSARIEALEVENDEMRALLNRPRAPVTPLIVSVRPEIEASRLPEIRPRHACRA